MRVKAPRASGLSRALRALWAAVVVLVTAGIATIAVAGGPAYALGRGRACVFLANRGAKGAGHVGWAFQEPPQDHWFFGSTEGAGGEEGGPNAAKIPPGQWNGAWVANGTWAAAKQAFKNAKANEHPGGYYTQYTCRNTKDSSVHAADVQAEANKGRGYDLWGNNCMNHAYDVLTTYGETMSVPNNPDWLNNWSPSLWVKQLVLVGGWENLQNL